MLSFSAWKTKTQFQSCQLEETTNKNNMCLQFVDMRDFENLKAGGKLVLLHATIMTNWQPRLILAKESPLDNHH